MENLFKIKLSIQVSIIIVALAFLIGIVISVLIFLLCLLENYQRDNKVDIENMKTINKKNDLDLENRVNNSIELFEINKMNSEKIEKTSSLLATEETKISELNKNEDETLNFYQQYQLNELNRFKNNQFRINKSKSLDLSHINSRYMLYGKRNPVFKNYLLKSKKSFLGYDSTIDIDLNERKNSKF
jgi:hypothetical protein